MNQKSKTCTEPFDSAQDKLRRSIQSLKWVGFLAILVLLVGCVGIARAQQPKKVPWIGFLSAAPSIDPAFLEGLRNLGYVEGKNIVVDFWSAQG
jgi:hypothetical protein